MRLGAVLLLGVFALLLLLALGSHVLRHCWRHPGVQATLLRGPDTAATLHVWIHGFDPNRGRLDAVAATLQQAGDVLRIDYRAHPAANAEPEDVARDIAAAVAAAVQPQRHRRIVLVAHSMGALLARQALLLGQDADAPWARLTGRVVLLAGANRGWGAEGSRPADQTAGTRLWWHAAEGLARLAGIGNLLLQMRAGTPFVANLRLAWLQRMRGSPVEVVQLLGDIDDVVASGDSQDLRTMALGRYAFLRVRGTGHGDIIDVAAPRGASAVGTVERSGEADDDPRAYRRCKLQQATGAPFAQVQADSEELPFPTEDGVRTVVFVLHGIRDLGRWSAEFETALRRRAGDGVRIVSPRYGYLGMGPFLLPAVRDRYVRWLMDEYTQTLARYPGVDPRAGVHFFGHSNGTFLLAKALEDYRAMAVNRVVFAGSVVPRGYDWQQRIRNGQVAGVRNYVATADWVVALFPRLFELGPMRLLGNRLGSAGHAGFDQGGACPASGQAEAARPAGAVSNVCFTEGGHSAFRSDRRVAEIVSFLLDADPPPPATKPRSQGAAFWLGAAAAWATWALLVTAVLYLGLRVVGAAPAPQWVVFVLYVLLVVFMLRLV